MYLVPGGVPGPGGCVPGLGGVHGPRGVGYLVGGVPGRVLPPVNRMNDKTGVKILPWPKLRFSR